MPPYERSPSLSATSAEADGDDIHLINPLWDCNGGSDWRTIEMYRALRGNANVQLWSRFNPAPEFAAHYPIQLIRPWSGRIPFGGTFIFVGAYFRVGHWYKAAFPRRTILIYNTHQPDRLPKVLARLRAWHRTPVEIVYTSPLLRRLSKHPGVVIESPIDLGRFAPQSQRCRDGTRPFRIGRLSRDIASQHHDEDPAVYSTLAAAGVVVRIMGGNCLDGSVHGRSGITLVATGTQPAPDFLRSLDCFYYRTSDRWLEAYGRVVFEAMACGLPVVCARRGGYADYIVHGVNGFLFDTTAQAVALILRLRDDARLRERVGVAARQAVEQLYRGGKWRRKQDFFLRAQAAAHDALPLGDGFDSTPSRLG